MDLRARLDIALEELLKIRGFNPGKKQRDDFFSLFCEFAQTDINLGIEYLLKTTRRQHDGYRYLGELEARMLAFIAEYDPGLAMKTYQKEFLDSKEDRKETTERAWERHLITPENAEMILSHLSTHSPNPEISSLFENPNILKGLYQNAIVGAFKANNADRIFELASEIGFEKTNNEVSEFATKTALERLKTKREGINNKERNKLLQDGLIARLSWSVDEINDLNFELDTHLQTVLDTMSDEEIWELSRQFSGALKHTLEEEVVLRVATKDPERIFLDPYKDVIKRNGIKTLLYGVIKDLAVLGRIGNRPQIDYNRKEFLSNVQIQIDDFRRRIEEIDENTEKGVVQANRLRKKISKLELDLKKKIVFKETYDSLFQSIALELDDRMVDVFEKKSGLRLTESQVKSMLEKFKEPRSMFVYIGKLRESGDKKQQELMKTFLESVVSGTFPAIRYQIFREHLDIVFASDPNQEKKWKDNISYKRMFISELESFQSEKKRIKSFLKEAIAHKHVEGDLAESLDEYLRAKPEDRKVIIERLNSHIQNMVDEGDASEKYQSIFVAQQLMRVLELSVSDMQKGLAKEFFDSITSLIKPDSAFYNDVLAIKDIVNKIQNPPESQSEDSFVTVEETEDPNVLLNMGTDVAGSCQNVNGNPSLNRNLISYIMDGKIKTLVVLDNQKTILGRALLRVLYDEAEKKPVLHLEYAYHRSGVSTVTNINLLLEIAMKRAEEMGYPLIVTPEYCDKDEKKYPNSIRSYGGPGSTEYVDSNRSQESSGEYVLGTNQFSIKRNG